MRNLHVRGGVTRERLRDVDPGEQFRLGGRGGERASEELPGSQLPGQVRHEQEAGLGANTPPLPVERVLDVDALRRGVSANPLGPGSVRAISIRSVPHVSCVTKPRMASRVVPAATSLTRKAITRVDRIAPAV